MIQDKSWDREPKVGGNARAVGVDQETKSSQASSPSPRLAIVSPFVDKSHGTERILAEWIDRLVGEFEIHVYSQNVEDVDASKIVWHRIPKLVGPHLLNSLWWFAANHLYRLRDNRVKGLGFDLVFSPGINCFDADVVSVHVVFAELLRRGREELKLTRNPIRIWPRLLHRRLYYQLIMWLERRVYRNPQTRLIFTSPRSAETIRRIYGRESEVTTVVMGLDQGVFNPTRRLALRETARQTLGVLQNRFAILLIGNDWRNKGLPALIDALRLLADLPVDLLVVGKDDPTPFRALLREGVLQGRIFFLAPRKDVEVFYSAADAYVGPSLEDTFSLPAIEAMACGLPLIISARAGVSALVTNNVDGLILDDPTDSRTLAEMVRHFYEHADFRDMIGSNAAMTARQYTWDRSSRQLADVLHSTLRQKRRSTRQTLASMGES